MVVCDRLGDLLRRAMADDDPLALPLDDDLLAQSDLAVVELDDRQRESVGRRLHLVDQRPERGPDGADGGCRGRDVDEISARFRMFTPGVREATAIFELSSRRS